MSEEGSFMTQQFLEIEKVDLVNKALDMKKVGFRLAQICATKIDRGDKPRDAAAEAAWEAIVAEARKRAAEIGRKWVERPERNASGSLFILHYSFVKDNSMVTFRSTLEPGQALESISCLYPYAFMYENELKDLFGIDVVNLNIDFGGHFYEVAEKAPFFHVPPRTPAAPAAGALKKEAAQNG